MFSSSIQCLTGLLIAAAILLILVRTLSTMPDQEDHAEPPGWFSRLLDSMAGRVAQLLLYLMLVVSIGGIVGVVTWEALKGIASTVALSPQVFIAAVVGAAASMVGFALFGLVLRFFGPILSVVYEEWTAIIAPVIGGTVGAAISGGLAVNVIYVVALSALTGGIALLLYQGIAAKERLSLKSTGEVAIAGVGLGAVNGVILAGVFWLLKVTVGIGWLLAG